MGAFKYIKQNFENSFKTRSEMYRKRLQAWRKQSSVFRVEKPTNPLSAREVGFKAKREFVVVRVRTPKGKYRRKKPDLGRKPAKNRAKENPGKPWQWFAEKKAKRYHKNLRVLGSYWIGQTGSDQYFEVVLKNEMDSTPKRMPVMAKAKPKA
ncbi:MAG: 50S ribosomal protein L15e [Candidatus Micrarchaeota archaeon]